jgi:hypothetical protein
MADEDRVAFRPPYLAFMTFWRFIDELGAHPLPPVIDRSLMSNKSGSDQVNLLAALRTFTMIDEDRTVQKPLIEFANADAEARKELLGHLVRHFYGDALIVSDQNGTEQQLHECFREKYGADGADTRRKSVTFFLHAARTAGISLSPHFPSTRSGSGAPGQKRARPRKKTPAGSAPYVGESPAPSPDSDYEISVQLSTGGTMRLTVNVNPLSLRGDDRAFFYEIVDKLADYADQRASTNKNGPSEEGPLSQPSGDGGGVTPS